MTVNLDNSHNGLRDLIYRANTPQGLHAPMLRNLRIFKMAYRFE